MQVRSKIEGEGRREAAAQQDVTAKLEPGLGRSPNIIRLRDPIMASHHSPRGGEGGTGRDGKGEEGEGKVATEDIG